MKIFFNTKKKNKRYKLIYGYTYNIYITLNVATDIYYSLINCDGYIYFKYKYIVILIAMIYIHYHIYYIIQHFAIFNCFFLLGIAFVVGFFPVFFFICHKLYSVTYHHHHLEYYIIYISWMWIAFGIIFIV